MSRILKPVDLVEIWSGPFYYFVCRLPVFGVRRFGGGEWMCDTHRGNDLYRIFGFQSFCLKVIFRNQTNKQKKNLFFCLVYIQFPFTFICFSLTLSNIRMVFISNCKNT